MTLQTSGAISLANVQTEFGGSNPISLSEYYAGGTYVPAGTTGTNGAVPSSGTISLNKFYGTTAATIFLQAESIYDFTGGGRNATTGYRLLSTGAVQYLINTTWTTLYNWVSPTSAAGDYEVIVNNVSGSGLTTGTVGSYEALTTTRQWTLVGTIGNGELTTFEVTIRRVGTSSTTGPVVIELNSDATF
jgi:hypothetical protein